MTQYSKITKNYILSSDNIITKKERIKDLFGNISSIKDVLFNGFFYISQNKFIEFDAIGKDNGFIEFTLDTRGVKPGNYLYKIKNINNSGNYEIVSGNITIEGPYKINDIEIKNYPEVINVN